MIQKKGLTSFDESEPEFLIGLMNRRKDWCTIVCLIGGGQEINTGEAGLAEWFEALQRRFDDWDVYHSGEITQKEYSWGQNLESKLALLNSWQRRRCTSPCPFDRFAPRICRCDFSGLTDHLRR
jgi:Uncharacterized conserved protein (DUF2075)